MQCTNCHFHNMPGSDVCGRCGTSLRLGRAADIDVHPPRAGAAALMMRRVLPYDQFWRFLRHDIRDPFRSFTSALRRPPDGFPDGVTPDGLFIRAIVPGWPQWYAGQRWQGAIFLTLYVTLMTLGLLDVMQGGAGAVLGLGFAVHAACWTDVLYQSWHGDSFLVRLVRAVATSLTLMFVIYGLPTLLMNRYAAPSRIGYTAGPTLVRGDVLLVNAAATREVGDVVIYTMRQAERPGPGERAGIGFAGQLVDRILARAGDHVVIRGGALTVNGQVTPNRWLDPAYRPVDLDVRVPAESCFILPSNLPARAANLRERPNVLKEMSIVPSMQITGVVWARIFPWDRRGRTL